MNTTVSRAVTEAVERKRRTEDALRKDGIVVPPELPRTPSSEEAKIRDLEEVARRAMVVCIVAARAEPSELPPREVLKLIAQRGLTRDLSQAEQVFLGKPTLTEKERAPFLWRYEAAYALAWGLGFEPNIGKLTKTVDTAELVRHIVPKSLVQLMETARLRGVGEILDMNDYLYRLHWAVRNAREKGQPIPGGAIPQVVYERHYAVNWLIGGKWD